MIPTKKGIGSQAIQMAYKTDGSQPRRDRTNQSIGFVSTGSLFPCHVFIAAATATNIDIGWPPPAPAFSLRKPPLSCVYVVLLPAFDGNGARSPRPSELIPLFSLLVLVAARLSFSSNHGDLGFIERIMDEVGKMIRGAHDKLGVSCEIQNFPFMDNAMEGG